MCEESCWNGNWEKPIRMRVRKAALPALGQGRVRSCRLMPSRRSSRDGHRLAAGQNCQHDFHVSLQYVTKWELHTADHPAICPPVIDPQATVTASNEEARCLGSAALSGSVNTESPRSPARVTRWSQTCERRWTHKHDSQNATVYELKYAPWKLFKCHLNTCHFLIHLKIPMLQKEKKM